MGASRSRHAGLLLVALLLGACSHTHGTAATTIAGAQLPPGASRWLRTWAHDSGMGRAVSADWVLTTHDRAGPYLSMANDDDTPVYLFDVHGHFAWNHSCPPGSSPSACTSVGTDAVFTLDESRLIVLDIGVVKGGLHLAALGTVGHVAL